MFTGLIESIGRIEELNTRGNYLVLTVSSSLRTEEINIGESISCDGACLTVISKRENRFVVEASQETVQTTIVGTYRTGSKLNLERALKVGDRLGGHFITGHVDTTGSVDSVRRVGESLELAVSHDQQFNALVVEKGSIAINGVSLTINQCRSGWLSVNLISHTARETTLGTLSSGSPVNLEFDLIGKYITKTNTAADSKGLTGDILRESGW